MLRRTIAIMTIASAGMLGILLFTTTPISTGPLGILAFFVFMYMTALGVLTFLFEGVSFMIPKILPVKNKRLKARELSLRESYYYATVAALAPIMLIAMQSVGQVGVYQILLVAFFVVIAWLYVTNRTM